MKKLAPALLALALAASVSQAQTYSETFGNWLVDWSIDEFDDRIIQVRLQSITPQIQRRNSYDIPIVFFRCFESEEFLFDMMIGTVSGETREVLVRVDYSQPFQVSISPLGILSNSFSIDLASKMWAGNERVAIREITRFGNNTFNISLNGFNQAYSKFSELCPTL